MCRNSLTGVGGIATLVSVLCKLITAVMPNGYKTFLPSM